MFAHAMIVLEARAGRGQDRACVVEQPGGLVVALADGAGNSKTGGEVADDVIAAACAVGPVFDAGELIVDVDERCLGRGESTAVIARITAAGIVGASVGDSGAYVVAGDRLDDLTAHQERKPLLGSSCSPTPFGAGPLAAGATLLFASDGLLKYAANRRIAEAASLPDLEAALAALVDLVRLGDHGSLQDDLAIVLVRLSAP
jgi:serine/threonine protein phosphatase PrpC